MKRVYYQLTAFFFVFLIITVFNIFPAKGEALIGSIKYPDVPTMASDSNASLQKDIDKSENTLINILPANIVFDIHHELNNTYNLPLPTNVVIGLNNLTGPKSNIHFEISDNMTEKLSITPVYFDTIEPGEQVNIQVAFIDKNLDTLNKPPLDSGYINILSENEILGQIHVTYCIDGFYDEHYTNNIDRYSGTKIRIGGSFYKTIGNINLRSLIPPIMTISFTPYILDINNVPNDMGVEVNNDSLGCILLNENGNFEFTDHTFEQSIIDGNKKVTFQIQMKQSVFDNIKEKAKQNPNAYNGNYLLSDLVFEFKDGCQMGGRISPLPLVYKIISGSYNDGDGSSGGGGSSSAGGNSGGSSNSSTSSGPGIDNTFTSNEYNIIESNDIGWRQSNNGSWQYLDPNGRFKTGWLWDPVGIWYYIDNTGNMVTGWAQINDRWYLLRPDGSMVTGWAIITDKWYYFNRDGSMKTGWFQDTDKKWYYFQNDGSMAVETTTPDGFQVGEEGVWLKGKSDDRT
ncbi:N-acetylmuramoyl-L-alanine amidase family protein [Hungatella sp.]|jgi:hypothetical protein|uniref:N-acetylmuramoyl-L-alanine amidase family protein n=1 Tax=Hungatella sp. TaxID=2613924 RepID=UPI002A8349B4|nr:N-acetylmuramoyl-L-alanine amidase family protein [Hungatella sp.]